MYVIFAEYLLVYEKSLNELPQRDARIHKTLFEARRKLRGCGVIPSFIIFEVFFGLESEFSWY